MGLFLCFDTETTSINPLSADLVGISLSFRAHEAYYIPFPDDKKQTQDRLQNLVPLFNNEKIKKIGQNIKYDLQVLNNYNIIVVVNCLIP